jgi:hypothetical protein
MKAPWAFLFLLYEFRNQFYTVKHQQHTTIQPMLIRQLLLAHSSVFCHKNLRLKNILIQKTEKGFNAIGIDYLGSRCCVPLNKKHIVKDRAAIAHIGIHALANGQSMRFLLGYSSGN